MNADIAARVIAAAKARKDDAVIDYEHQTLLAETNGKPAPAAGWWQPDQLEWRADGLYATNVQWTAAAKNRIEAGEYRYLSPVIAFNPATGEVTDILMAALTNYAAIDGLDSLSSIAAARFDFFKTHQENSTVKRDQLIELLGLDNEATDEQLTAALKSLKASDTTLSELRQALDIKEGDDLKSQVAALKSQATKAADPTKYVPLDQFESLKTELASLKTDATQKEVDSLVQQGLADGKLLADQEDWARSLGKTDVASLKSYLDKTPVIAALKGTQTKGKKPASGDDDTHLSESQIAICRATGIDPADYQKLNAEDNS